MRVSYSSIRHPQSNPTERVMRELGRLFRTMCSDRHTRWARVLPEVEVILNVTTHHSTGYSPHELHFGSPPLDIINKIIRFPPSTEVNHDVKIMLARERMIKQFESCQKNQKSKSRVCINIGDLVLVQVPHLSNAIDKFTKKFFHLYEGPYRVSKTIGDNAYVLVEVLDPDRIKGTYNRLSLRRYHRPV